MLNRTNKQAAIAPEALKSALEIAFTAPIDAPSKTADTTATSAPNNSPQKFAHGFLRNQTMKKMIDSENVVTGLNSAKNNF